MLHIGGKDPLDVYYSSLSINYRRDTSIKSGTISKLIREMVGAARRWGSRVQCEWVPCVGSPCNGTLSSRVSQLCRSRLRTAVSVTVTFRGSNITRRGSNHPVTPTPDPARPGGVGEHQRRPAPRLPASSRPPNIGQMRILNQVPPKRLRPLATSVLTVYTDTHHKLLARTCHTCSAGRVQTVSTPASPRVWR